MANGTTIANYGSPHMIIGLGDHRFEWDVTVADVTSPILEADFLMEYHLASDHTMGLLLDLDNNTTVAGKVFAAHSYHVNFVNKAYTKLLDERPELTTLAFSPDKAKHGVQHHITTEGPPSMPAPAASPPTNSLRRRRNSTSY